MKSTLVLLAVLSVFSYGELAQAGKSYKTPSLLGSSRSSFRPSAPRTYKTPSLLGGSSSRSSSNGSGKLYYPSSRPAPRVIERRTVIEHRDSGGGLNGLVNGMILGNMLSRPAPVVVVPGGGAAAVAPASVEPAVQQQAVAPQQVLEQPVAPVPAKHGFFYYVFWMLFWAVVIFAVIGVLAKYFGPSRRVASSRF
jgi:hypothetical protein